MELQAYSDSMPVISAFLGIVVRIFHNDHNPPHVHVIYAEFEAIISISNGRILAGKLPKRAQSLFEEWRLLRRVELERAWDAAQLGKMPTKIKPLE